MHTLAIPWRSRWFHLSVLIALGSMLFLLATQAVGAQAAPPQAHTSQGDDIRTLYFIVFGLGAAVFIFVEALIIWVALRYRRRDADELPPQIHGSNVAEMAWTAIPFAIVLALFIASFIVLDDVTSAPAEGADLQVEVRGQQWAWEFFYADPLDAATTSALSDHPDDTTLQVDNAAALEPLLGLVAPLRTIRIDSEHLNIVDISGDTVTVVRGVNATVPQTHAAGATIARVFSGRESRPEERLADGQDSIMVSVITLPTDRNILLNIVSQDVIHAFYTPQFLYKVDAVPGRVNQMWLNITDAGFYQSQCAEYCGLNHARMLFTVNALSPADFDTWFAAKAQPPEAPPPPSDGGGETPEGGPAPGGPDPAHGQELFFANGCNACHGNMGEGGIGPTIASTNFTLEQEIQQYRTPRGQMPPFPADRVSDADVADIYAWLQTLPLPDTIVPGEGTP